MFGAWDGRRDDLARGLGDGALAGGPLGVAVAGAAFLAAAVVRRLGRRGRRGGAAAPSADLP